MKLYLAEHSHQVADFLEKDCKSPAVWVALGPGAMHALGKRSIPFSIPEDYLPREEIEPACVAQFERLDKACRQLDEFLWVREPFLREWGIRPFYFHLWQLGQLADLLHSRALILDKILRRLKVQEIHVHKNAPGEWGLFGLGFSLWEPVWGSLLELPGWPARIVAWPEPNLDTGQEEIKGDTGWRGLSSQVSTWARSQPLAFSLLKSWRQGWWANLVNLIRSGPNFEVAVCNEAYEWRTVMPNLMAAGHPVTFINSLDLIGNGYRGQPTAEMGADPEWQVFRQALTLKPVDFSGLVRDRFSFIREKAPELARTMVVRLKKKLSTSRVKALLVSGAIDYATYVIKQYCRRQKIQVLSWQIGAAWHNGRITQRNDLLNLVGCDRMLVYGEGVQQAYAASPLAQEEGCRIECVGMPSLKKLRAIAPQRPRERTRILWPFGGYYQNRWYCGFSPPHSDRVYYQEQMVILEHLLKLLEAHPGVELTVKLHPSYLEIEDPPWAKDLTHRDRLRMVKREFSFVELLGEHDVCLIDSPTTALLQAVATRLPVFALMSVIRWSDEAIRLLRRRAWVAESAAELMTGLSKYLQDGPMVDVNHDEFLRQYGLGREDGEQVAQTIVEMR